MTRVQNYEMDEAIAKIDMESWLDREGLDYKVTRGSRGTQLNVRECPCCGSTKWKVYLNADSGLGNCFAGDCTQRTFNKWSFIRNVLGGLSNREVIDHIKAVAKEQGWRPVRKKSMAVNIDTDLVVPDSMPIPINGRNLKYLANRNITTEIAQYFNLRFSLKGTFNYTDDDGKNRTQSYANRIIIPIFDLEGDLVSFQGRDIVGTADKKYLFPPGFASTGAHLYNGHNAIGAEEVIVGEGAFDVMAIKIAIDSDQTLRQIVPIGTFGKHLSHGDENTQLAKLLKLKESGLKRITFMWDSEPAAIEAAVEVALLLRKYGFVVRLALLPPGRDPNEVAPSVVRDAYWKAETVNEAVAVKLRLRKH